MNLASLMMLMMIPTISWILAWLLYPGQGLSLGRDYLLPWFFLGLPLETALFLDPGALWCLPLLPLCCSYPLVYLWCRYRAWEKIEPSLAFPWSHPLFLRQLHGAWVYPGLWLVFLLWLGFPRWEATLDLGAWWHSWSGLILEHGLLFLLTLPLPLSWAYLAFRGLLQLQNHHWRATTQVLLALHVYGLSSPLYGVPLRKIFHFFHGLVSYITAIDLPREARKTMPLGRKILRFVHYRPYLYLLPLLLFLPLECYVSQGQIHYSFRLFLLLSLWYLVLSLLREISSLPWIEHSVRSDLIYQEDARLFRYPRSTLLFLEDHEEWPWPSSQSFLATLVHRARLYPLRRCSETHHRFQVQRRVQRRGEAWVREASFRCYQGNRRWMHSQVPLPPGGVPRLFPGLCSSLDQSWRPASLLLEDSVHHTMALRRTLMLPPQGLSLGEMYGPALPGNGFFPAGPVTSLEQLNTANQVIQLAWLVPRGRVSPWRKGVSPDSPSLSNVEPDVLLTLPRSSGDFTLALDFKLSRGMIHNILGSADVTEARLTQYQGALRARMPHCSPGEYLDLEGSLNHAQKSLALLCQRHPDYWKHWAQGLDYLSRMPPVYMPQMDTHLLQDQASLDQARQVLREQSLRLQEKFPDAPCQDLVCAHAREAFGQSPLAVKRLPRGNFLCHSLPGTPPGGKKSIAQAGEAAWTFAMEQGVLAWIEKGPL